MRRYHFLEAAGDASGSLGCWLQAGDARLRLGEETCDNCLVVRYQSGAVQFVQAVHSYQGNTPATGGRLCRLHSLRLKAGEDQFYLAPEILSCQDAGLAPTLFGKGPAFGRVAHHLCAGVTNEVQQCHAPTFMVVGRFKIYGKSVNLKSTNLKSPR